MAPFKIIYPYGRLMHHLLMVFMLAYWFTRHCRCTRSRHAHDCSKTTPVLLSRWPSWITALASVRYRHYLCFPKAITNRPPTHTATSIIFLLVPSYRFFFPRLCLFSFLPLFSLFLLPPSRSSSFVSPPICFSLPFHYFLASTTPRSPPRPSSASGILQPRGQSLWTLAVLCTVLRLVGLRTLFVD